MTNLPKGAGGVYCTECGAHAASKGDGTPIILVHESTCPEKAKLDAEEARRKHNRAGVLKVAEDLGLDVERSNELLDMLDDPEKVKQAILNAAATAMVNFSYYDRKESSAVPVGLVSAALELGIISKVDIIRKFVEALGWDDEVLAIDRVNQAEVDLEDLSAGTPKVASGGGILVPTVGGLPAGILATVTTVLQRRDMAPDVQVQAYDVYDFDPGDAVADFERWLEERCVYDEETLAKFRARKKAERDADHQATLATQAQQREKAIETTRNWQGGQKLSYQQRFEGQVNHISQHWDKFFGHACSRDEATEDPRLRASIIEQYLVDHGDRHDIYQRLCQDLEIEPRPELFHPDPFA